ncbi:hypothetical protein WJ07_24625 [Burkholderia vietnamiensis]|nr:hypothetical protein WJ07_24625 [Burkholderia vietnamiensis]
MAIRAINFDLVLVAIDVIWIFRSDTLRQLKEAITRQLIVMIEENNIVALRPIQTGIGCTGNATIAVEQNHFNAGII